MTMAQGNSKWCTRADLILVKFQTLLSKLKTKTTDVHKVIHLHSNW